ncbi:MAG TPA: hypothetical protein VMM13_08635 [Euzebya sp.]|nr:hypothetical protein [Euzebya sp.]
MTDPFDESPSALQRTLASAALQPTVDRFAAAGVQLHLVGGPVRDSILGRDPSDLDLCTPASPDRIRHLVSGLGSVVDTGAAFGTIMLHQPGHEPVEITQFRGETYQQGSRKTSVTRHRRPDRGPATPRLHRQRDRGRHRHRHGR